MNVDQTWVLVRAALDDAAVAARLTTDPAAALAEIGARFPRADDATKAEMLQEFLVAYAVAMKLRLAAREEEHARVREMSENFRKGLAEVVSQIGVGYDRVMTMYTVAFYAGLALVAAALVVSLAMKEFVLGAVFGGLGVADVVALMVFRPADELQKSRGNHAQLQAVFFNWANDVRNWTVYLERVDAASGGKPPFEEFERVSKRMLENTETMMDLIQRYCEGTPAAAPARAIVPRAVERGGAAGANATTLEDPPAA